MPQFGAPHTVNYKGVIYDRKMFIVLVMFVFQDFFPISYQASRGLRRLDDVRRPSALQLHLRRDRQGKPRKSSQQETSMKLFKKKKF